MLPKFPISNNVNWNLNILENNTEYGPESGTENSIPFEIGSYTKVVKVDTFLSPFYHHISEEVRDHNFLHVILEPLFLLFTIIDIINFTILFTDIFLTDYNFYWNKLPHLIILFILSTSQLFPSNILKKHSKKV